uniref:TetR/AcrR family transcriptional regulator n=1 Tax=Thaumasiovibrio occultus TaxID=1891184 RepID=UPI000B356B81|nr:TetR/AcrR family transcriptional regulator [Thaumasiovibrio occultus]
MSAKPGRPVGKESDARKRLIDAARPLFIQLTYDKVSTRRVAESAGVNVALIRYYFSNKAGLFEAVIQDTIAPMQAALQADREHYGAASMADVLKAYYRCMAPHPDFPRLVARVMNEDDNSAERKIFESHFRRYVRPFERHFLRLIPNEIRDNIDPDLARMSFMSLMVFPFLLPKAMAAIHNIHIDEDFLERLADHNIALLKYGMLHPAPADNGDLNP